MARPIRVWPVVGAFILAVALEIAPLPDALQLFRPPLTVMVMIYWAMMWPERVGVTTAFFIGIALDLLHGQLLGQNALALSAVTYLTLRFHLQIRIFPLWQLTMTVLALLMVDAFLQWLTDGIAGIPSTGWARGVQALTGALLWPLLMGIMDRLRQQVEYRNPNFN